MADRNINILISLQSVVTGNLARVSQVLDKTTSSLKSLDKATKQTRKIAGDIAFLGTAVSGAFAIAMKTAERYSLDVQKTNDSIANSYKALQIEIANAILPMYQRLAAVANNLVRIFKSMDDALKRKILTIAATGAALTVLIGLFGNFAARIASLIIGVARLGVALAGLAVAHPVILTIVAVVGTFAFLVYKVTESWEVFNNTVVPILVNFENLLLSMKAAVHDLAASFFDAFAAAIEPFQRMIDLVQKLPGGKVFSGLSKALKSAGDDLKILAEIQRDEVDKILQTMYDKMIEQKSIIADIVWSVGSGMHGIVNNLKEIIDDITNIKSGMNVNINETLWDGFKRGMYEAEKELVDFGKLGETVAKRMVGAMSTYFSEGFFAVITGDFEKLEDVFKDFAKSVLKAITDMIAQMLVLNALRSVFGAGFSTPAYYHSGGSIGNIPRAHSGRAFDEVDVRLQKGEGVVSRRGMNSLGREGLKKINQGESVTAEKQNIVINLQTWDASDIVRNRKTIENIINSAIVKNSTLRGVVKNA